MRKTALWTSGKITKKYKAKGSPDKGRYEMNLDL
jgi:hypothetical protein